MILGVNGIRLIGKRSGVGRSIEAFLACLAELDHPFDDVRVYTPQPLGADVYLPPNATNVVLRSSFPPAAWEQFTLPRAHGSKDLLFCPSYVIPLLARCCPTFLIHHGSYEGYPEAFDWWTRNKARAIFSLSARRATMVCTVSEHSKRDMGSDLPFILYVGKPTERRNLSRLVQAFAELKAKDGIPHKLLIVGADQPGRSPFREVVASLGLQKEVIVLGYTTHTDLSLIYNASDLLVYPSSYEGFGMPVLEAMACGTPVIALNNTAFPEFAGGVAHLIENAQVPTLRREILAVLNDPVWRAQMAEAGPKRAADYAWRLVIRRYLDLMIPLASGEGRVTALAQSAPRTETCQ